MRTHPLNVGYLVVGLVFLGLSASWALHEAGIVSADGVQWVLPGTLVVAGAAGLLASALRATRGGAVRTPEPLAGTGEPEIEDPPTYRYEEPTTETTMEPYATTYVEQEVDTSADAPGADTDSPDTHTSTSTSPDTSPDDTMKDESR